jgi:uncharacterized protein with HEPN domain
MRHDRPKDLLQDILDFISRIERWTAHEPDWVDAPDERTLYAVLHALQCIGEAGSRLPSEIVDRAPEVPWAKIRGMRNVIVHDYTGIDKDIIRQTVMQWLPELRVAVEAISQRLSPN